MRASRWRRLAAPVIAEVLAATSGADEPAIRKALRSAYPFGEYKHHPLKIWRDEIKRQRGLKPPLGYPFGVDLRQLPLFA